METTADIYKTPRWLRYAIPLLGVGAMIGVRILLISSAEGRYPLILFLIPVILSTWFGGARPGLLAAFAGVVAGACLFKPYNLQITTTLGHERLALFTVVSLFCIFVVSKLQDARYRAEYNERKLEQEISERRKMEDSLREEVAVRMDAETALAKALAKAEKANLAKTEFLANMSHEIRTPMNVVVGLSGILAMSAPLTPKQKEFIATLKLSADSLLSLINDMLDVAKIEASSMDLEKIPFNLRHVSEDILNIMALKARQKNLDFSIESSGLRHENFIGDPNRLKQIIMNLCSNAIKFTHAGSVEIILQSSPLIDGTDEVSISIKDTGIGISADKMEDIFGKFIQADSTINRKYGGSGLGLTITKDLTKMMGGEISVESQCESGSVFTVKIPLQKSLADASQSRSDVIALNEAVPPKMENKKVLLVEDHPPNILVAGSFLEFFGFEYDVAMNGAEALRKLETERYFAILMDVQMQGLNGFETTRIIRENERRTGQERTPIVGMTAHAMAGDKDLCLEAGMDDYISKPFDPDMLERKLKKLYPDDESRFYSPLLAEASRR